MPEDGEALLDESGRTAKPRLFNLTKCQPISTAGLEANGHLLMISRYKNARIYKAEIVTEEIMVGCTLSLKLHGRACTELAPHDWLENRAEPHRPFYNPLFGGGRGARKVCTPADFPFSGTIYLSALSTETWSVFGAIPEPQEPTFRSQ